MNTKTLSDRALSVIEQYEHFRMGKAVSSVPYFNNKRGGARVSLRVYNGKGSPRDIFEETEDFITKNHIDADGLGDDSLKKLLTDNNIGIDCSGFAYYVLNAESEENNKGSLDRKLHFVNCKGLIGKLRCSLRPAENCDVATLAATENSRVIPLKEISPGDIITMTGSPEGWERDHILVVRQVDYQNFAPTMIYYSHAAAYPEDGIYGTGIKQGTITISDANGSIIQGEWSERARFSKPELRRLNWM